MNLATEISNFVSDLMDRASGSVHVANYTSGDTVTYALSDDSTYVRLIVHRAEKRNTSEAIVSTIAPNLVRMLTESTEQQRNVEGIGQLTRELEEQG